MPSRRMMRRPKCTEPHQLDREGMEPGDCWICLAGGAGAGRTLRATGWNLQRSSGVSDCIPGVVYWHAFPWSKHGAASGAGGTSRHCCHVLAGEWAEIACGALPQLRVVAGDKLVADVYAEVLAESLYRVLNATVAIKYQYTQQKERDNRTCHNLMDGQPCVFSVAGGGSMIYTFNNAAWHLDLSWYVFGTGVEGGKADAPKGVLRIAVSPTHTMGGVRGPITERLFHVYRRHLPVLGDSGLLAGIYFVDGYREKLQKDQAYGRNLQDILVHDGVRDGPVPEGRPLMIVTWKNNISSNVWETSGLNFKSPFLQLYIKLVNEWAKKYQVIFQPCENVASMWHVAFQKYVNKQLPEGAVPVLVHNNFRNYSQILRLCAAADVSVSGRLHSGVMCNSVGTPAVFLSNNLKFVDYLSSMGLPHMRLNVPKDDNFAIDAFAHRVHDMVARALEERAQISAALRASQRESHKLHVRAMASWLRSAESKMAPRLARLSCCSHGITIEQGTVYDDHFMNIKIGCRQP